MRRKKDLFDLIQAMSRSEKRYFTLDAQKGDRKDSRYLMLFKAINKQEVYDEKSLKAEFGARLADDKKRLYENILRSMRDYRSSKSHLARIKELILDAKFLYERRLYQQSKERLRAAKEIALELGDRLTLLELNKEERRLWKYLREEGYATELANLMKEMDQYQIELKEELEFLDFHDQLLITSNQNPKLSDEQQQNLREKYAFMLDGEVSPPDSVQGKLRYYQCYVFLYRMLGQPDKIYDFCQEVVNCWNTYPKYKEENYYRYIMEASNLLYAAFTYPEKFHTLPQLFKSLEEESPSSLHDQQVLFEQVTNYRLVYHINSGDFSDLDDLLISVDEGLQKFSLNPRIKSLIQTNLTFVLFAAARYADCVFRCDTMITSSRSLSERSDLIEGIRILRLMAVFELDDIGLLEAGLRSTVRYFRQQDPQKKRPFISFSIQLFKQLSVASHREQKEIFSKGYQALQDDQKLKKAPLGLNELMGHWCKSKISTYSVAEFISGKATS